MLKNEEMKQLLHASNILEAVIQYIVNSETNDFYDKTGVTSKDIHDSIKALTHIHTVEKLKHLKTSEQANKWNKANPEKHRKHSRDYERRKKGGVNNGEI